MSLATLNGVSVTKGRVQTPAWGIWWSDVDLDDDAELSGAATLVIADVTLAGTIVAGGAIHGRAAYRIVGGKGGWHQSAPAKSYHNDAGVKVSTVAADIANEVGETLADAPTTRRGAHYARAAGLASNVMHELAPQAWYVGHDGITRFGKRSTTTYSGDAPRSRVDLRVGVTELATESLAGLVPGVVIDGRPPAVDVEYELDAKRLTARIVHGAVTSRRLLAWSRLLDALDPVRRYRGTYEFRVINQDGERLNLQPVRASSGFGDLQRVTMRGPAGVKAKVTPGELVLATFIDADPSRPVCYAHDAPDAPGWMPVELLLGETPQLPIARKTDTILAGPFAGVITGPPVSRIKAGV